MYYIRGCALDSWDLKMIEAVICGAGTQASTQKRELNQIVSEEKQPGQDWADQLLSATGKGSGKRATWFTTLQLNQQLNIHYRR